MTNEQKYDIISSICKVVYTATGLTHNNVGNDLAHLITAIVSDKVCELPENSQIMKILSDAFAEEYGLWKFIKTEWEEEDVEISDERDAGGTTYVDPITISPPATTKVSRTSVICVSCGLEIKLEEASFCESLSGWLGHVCCSGGVAPWTGKTFKV